MGHYYFVSQLAQQPAHPRRMHPRFQRNPAPRHFPEHFFHRFRSRAQPLFQQLLPPLHPTHSTNSIDRPSPNQSSVSGPEKFLVCLAPAVLIFFIAGLLYLLRFKRVDNLGAYRIPPETGLLIPSVLVTIECEGPKTTVKFRLGTGNGG